MCIVLLTSCANRGSKTQKSEKTKDSLNQSFKMLALTPISFSNQVVVGKFQTECSMLERLTLSIVESSKNYLFNIKSKELSNDNKYELIVDYINVVPHRWTFLSLRPNSNATFKVTVLINGVPLHSTTKLIGSAVAFGACDRLDKIAIAGGRYITKWLHSLN